MEGQKMIKQLTFGVAFDNMFKLLDMWGEIADDILYHSKFFSPVFFDKISAQYTTERSLFNQKEGHRLIISASNLVFTQNIINEYDSEYADFKKRVINYIVPEILSSKKLVVKRLGMVYVSELDQHTIKKFASQYFRPEINGINDFRFSKKEATPSGLIMNGSDDFINKIFSVGNLGDNLQGISYDYQIHFAPKRQDVRDTIDHFITKANDGFKKDILALLEAQND